MSFLSMLGLSNSPWPRDRFQAIPQMTVEWHPYSFVYVAQDSSSRVIPQSALRLAPATTKWTVRAGAMHIFGADEQYKAKLELGHTSEHVISTCSMRCDPTESSDYLLLSFEMKL